MARQIAMTTPTSLPVVRHATLTLFASGLQVVEEAAYIEDENGFRIGSEVKVKLEKSRFGTQGRNCTFRILWGAR